MKNKNILPNGPAAKAANLPDNETLYYHALCMAFKKFLEEEEQRNAYTELRLVKAIEAARTLYR